mgnify:CR=1 FL=1
MKNENENLKKAVRWAEKAGVVTAILVEAGQTVMENTPLVVIA